MSALSSDSRQGDGASVRAKGKMFLMALRAVILFPISMCGYFFSWLEGNISPFQTRVDAGYIEEVDPIFIWMAALGGRVVHRFRIGVSGRWEYADNMANALAILRHGFEEEIVRALSANAAPVGSESNPEGSAKE